MLTPIRPTGQPTLFAGITYRSWLEAFYAAFWMRLGWPAEYEPRLGLKSYRADFLLGLKRPVLVEVKPAHALPELELHTGRLAGCGWEGSMLLVGDGPLRADDGLGALAGLFLDRGARGWTEARYGRCGLCDRPALDVGERCGVCARPLDLRLRLDLPESVVFTTWASAQADVRRSVRTDAEAAAAARRPMTLLEARARRKAGAK